MKELKFTGILIIFLLTGFSFTLAQDDNNPKDISQYNKKLYYLDPLVFYKKDTNVARLDLYIEIPLINLQFKKNQLENTFESTIDYTIVIINSKNDAVVNKSYTELIKNNKEDQKNVNEGSDYIIKQFNLNPDNYTLNFTFKDRVSFEETSSEIKFEVKNITGKDILFSDLMIVSDYKEDETGMKSITPLVNNNIGNVKDFFLFYVVYNMRDLPVPSEYIYKVTNDQNKTIVEGALSYVLQVGENKKVEKIPTDNFSMGNYKLEITNKQTNEIVAKKDFIFRWGDLPVSIKSLDDAIAQMVYIATDDELENIKNAKSNAEKEQRFIKFWKDKNPNPKSLRNELMIVYYNRIKVASQRYSTTYKPGWKTDMGMVYVIYGEPGNIDKHPFGDSETGYDKPYEIWDYYDISKRFIFIDDSGFGDYRLITPMYDREATRIRY